LVLLDQNLPDGTGSALARKLAERFDGIHYVLLTGFSLDPQTAADAAQVCSAILYKDASAADIRAAVVAALGPANPVNAPADWGRLSTREREVFGYIALGLQNKEISALVGLSEKSVRNIITRLFRKLNVANRTEAALLFRTDNAEKN
jgi:DNA-binding NarL/FixJ family response regulator